MAIDLSKYETTCVVCNKKFQSAESLTQHILNKKDKKHSSFRKDNNFIKDKKPQPEIHGLIHALFIKSKLAGKQVLTEDDKTLLENVQKFLEEEHERLKEKCKLENKRLGLSDDTPTTITLKVLEQEHQMKIEESKRKTKELKTQIKDFNSQIKESNMKFEEFERKLRKEGWDIIEKDVKDRKEKGIPNYIEKRPIEPTEKIECCPKKCEKEPFKKKGNNTILNMAVG